jgi:hypothetical protein
MSWILKLYFVRLKLLPRQQKIKKLKCHISHLFYFIELEYILHSDNSEHIFPTEP